MNLNDQIKCVRREISMREVVYPRRVESGALSQAKADHEIEVMKAVEQTLWKVLHGQEFKLE